MCFTKKKKRNKYSQGSISSCPYFSQNNQEHCMCIPRVSSVPTGVIVAEFCVCASVLSALLGDTLENKEKRGEGIRSGPSGPSGYIALATSGVPNGSKRATKSAMAHKWTGCLHYPCRLGGPQRFKEGDKVSSGPQVGQVATYPLPPPPPPQRFKAGDRISSGPQVGRVAT